MANFRNNYRITDGNLGSNTTPELAETLQEKMTEKTRCELTHLKETALRRMRIFVHKKQTIPEQPDAIGQEIFTAKPVHKLSESIRGRRLQKSSNHKASFSAAEKLAAIVVEEISSDVPI